MDYLYYCPLQGSEYKYKRAALQAFIKYIPPSPSATYKQIGGFSKFCFAMGGVQSSPLCKTTVSVGKKGNHVTTITHGYQGERFSDRVPVNLGSLLSLKERAPSAPSFDFDDNFIARESKR